MKIYIDTQSWARIAEERELPFYMGENYASKVRVYFNTEPVNWYPTITFLKANGRRKGPINYDVSGYGVETVSSIGGMNSAIWYYFDFTLSSHEGILDVPGTLDMTMAINFVDTNGTLASRSLINFKNNVIKTTVYGEEGNIIVFGDNADEIILNAIEDISANVAKIAALDIAQVSINTKVDELRKFGRKLFSSTSSTGKYMSTTEMYQDAFTLFYGVDDTCDVVSAQYSTTTYFLFKVRSNISTIISYDTNAKQFYLISALDNYSETPIFIKPEDVKYDNSPAIDSSRVTIGTFTFGNISIALYAPTNMITVANKVTGKGYLVAVDSQGTVTNAHSNENVYIDGDTLHAKEVNAVVVAPEKDSLSALGTNGNAFSEGYIKELHVESFNNKPTANKSLVEDAEITKLKGLPSQESLNRTIEDLQSQIDGINAGQNLADIVGTYADLASYNKTNLKANDKIQVLADEEHEGDSSVYNWNGAEFVYVGSYGQNAYTKAEVDRMHDELDERMNQHESNVNAEMVAFKGEVNTKIAQNNTTVNTFRNEILENVDAFKGEILEYVDEAIGNIPALLDALIGTTEEA